MTDYGQIASRRTDWTSAIRSAVAHMFMLRARGGVQNQSGAMMECWQHRSDVYQAITDRQTIKLTFQHTFWLRDGSNLQPLGCGTSRQPKSRSAARSRTVKQIRARRTLKSLFHTGKVREFNTILGQVMEYHKNNSASI